MTIDANGHHHSTRSGRFIHRLLGEADPDSVLDSDDGTRRVRAVEVTEGMHIWTGSHWALVTRRTEEEGRGVILHHATGLLLLPLEEKVAVLVA